MSTRARAKPPCVALRRIEGEYDSKGVRVTSRFLKSRVVAAGAVVAVLGLTAAAIAATATPSQVKTRKTGVGTVIVDGKASHTLYLFEKDKGTQELVQRRVRGELAAVPDDRQAEGGRRREAVAARHDQAVERHAAGHVQQAPALLVQVRQGRRVDEGPGRGGVRRLVVRRQRQGGRDQAVGPDRRRRVRRRLRRDRRDRCHRQRRLHALELLHPHRHTHAGGRQRGPRRVLGLLSTSQRGFTGALARPS